MHPMHINADVVIVGGGPAGLQTAIYSASEGFSTLLIEKHKLGGQIRQTPKLENLAGQAPNGVSGPRFASKMKRQAETLGTMVFKGNVNGVDTTHHEDCCLLGVTHASKTQFHAFGKVIVVATGATWRKLDAPGVDKYNFKTFHYGPHHTMKVNRGGRYIVVGGGNSSGQSIISLATHAEKVTVLARSGLNKMSQYLIDRIESADNIDVLNGVTIAEVLERGVVTNNGDTIHADHTYFCGGMSANTAFLRKSEIQLDRKGFIVTNMRELTLQTNLDNVFAVGDVRSNVWRKSVGNAIADANTVMSEIFRFLQTKQDALSANTD